MLVLSVRIAMYYNSRRQEAYKKEVFAQAMTTSERDIAVDLLGVFDREMAKEKISWFLYSGTLLGSWRHHGIIPWDDDVDILVNQSQKEQLMTSLKDLAPDYIIVEWAERIKFFSKFSKKTNMYIWKWPFLDIQFYAESATHIWDISVSSKHIKYKKTDTFPLHKRPFEKYWLPAPRNPVATIMTTFGDNLGKCMSLIYNHRVEEFQKPVDVDCRTMKDRFPFVHRKAVNGSMVETLILRDLTVQSMVVNESLNLLTDPYDPSKLAPTTNYSPREKRSTTT
jgi:hypothetical protein